MKNILTQDSFFSVGFSTKNNVLQNENRFYEKRENNKVKNSYLFDLFFGKQKLLKEITAVNQDSEPDYYSSYE